MVDSVSLQNASVGSSANVAGTPRGSASSTTANSASAERSINDVVDLSQAAKLAQDFRTSSGLSGQKLVDTLAQSLDQGKSITDSFAAQLQSGRTANANSATNSGTGSETGDFASTLRAAVADIMRSGKPGNVFDSVINRLLGR